ncbi:hypothetical protein ColLi_00193 [Colletotrichum liriopes]|uniref:Uncharacterized protein n=1 Tax=Colletotrichum liriopes TaxID=708192 RepID=A0AA37GAL0_9PEZI|nr:hypothetical protein ColLi_00193 [Colletotrichum liriopes]
MQGEVWSQFSPVVANKPVPLQEMKRVVHHDMRIAATNAERVDGHATQSPLRPSRRLRWELQVPRVADLWISLFEPNVARDDAALERQHTLDHGGHSRGTLQVADIALQRTDIQRLLRRPMGRKDLSQCARFDGIAHWRARAVGLGKPCKRGVQIGPGIDVSDQRNLAGLCRLRDAGGPAVLVRRRVPDDGTDDVPVADCVRHPLEHHGPEPLAAGVPVCAMVKAV